MTSVFGNDYANAYDALYSDKDYEAECDLIETVMRQYGRQPVRSILDLGCGTGNHALPLMHRGYELEGIDRSEAMLAQLRDKAAERGLRGGSFQQGDICELNLQRQFDLVLMMFAVLGYQLNNDDVLKALSRARGHLKEGGLLLFDVWYGPAVLNLKPSRRSKVIPNTNGELERTADGSLDVARHQCTVTYEVRHKKDPQKGRIEETHRMRYFFPLELDLFLKCTGFERLRIGAFPEFTRDPDENTWNVLVAARAIE
jgi:SAM-dependent methyltransferase